MTAGPQSSALEIIRGSDGRSFVAVDSVIDMWGGIACALPEDDPARKLCEQLLTAFRPASSYARPGDKLVDDDGTQIEAYDCPTCTATVLRGRKAITSEIVVLDVEPEPNGQWIPCQVKDGVPLLMPWSPQLDGIGNVVRPPHARVRGDL